MPDKKESLSGRFFAGYMITSLVVYYILRLHLETLPALLIYIPFVLILNSLWRWWQKGV